VGQQKGKQFFFEKKKQKTSIHEAGAIGMKKSFLVLFFKKERLSF
jgi:hypothetical protein